MMINSFFSSSYVPNMFSKSSLLFTSMSNLISNINNEHVNFLFDIMLMGRENE